MHFGEPERHAASEKGGVQIGQQLGAGEINSRNRAEEKDDQPRRILARAQQLEQALADKLGIEVEKR